MAPNRAKKNRSSIDSKPAARSQTVAIESPIRTPEQSPQKKPMQISEGQKQALVDNLQLEITERARKLRAQYALQAQSLRTRIELRINRIPTSLRKANMGQLLQKYAEMSEGKQKSLAEPSKTMETIREPLGGNKRILISEDAESKAVTRSRGTKRKSEEMDQVDKENSVGPTGRIPNPKKRPKGNAATSRQVTNPSTVLSPKSANSRTFPHSPIRPVLGSPQKTHVSRPVSPLKPHPSIKTTSPAKAAAVVATAALSSMINEKPKVGRLKAVANTKATNASTIGARGGRGKRGAGAIHEAEDMRKVSNTSNISSASSTGTTIVKNARKAPVVAARKNEPVVRAAGRKVAAAVDAPPSGRRVLRKR